MRPESQMFLTIEETASAVGVSRSRLATLVRIGIVDAVSADAQTFTADTVARLRRMLRLRRDLGVNMTGAAIILDLVDRLDHIQRDRLNR